MVEKRTKKPSKANIKVKPKGKTISKAPKSLLLKEKVQTAEGWVRAKKK